MHSYKGTPLFMSPEKVRNQYKDIYQEEKVDIYSFGVLLYHMLTGDYPTTEFIESKSDLKQGKLHLKYISYSISG